MSGAHAPLPPSAAGKWVPCPGSRMLEIQYPEPPDTPDTLNGDAAHWGGSETLHGRPIALGQVAPNGVVLTDEMIEGAEMYVDDIFSVHPVQPLHIEERIPIPYVHEQNWGTPDCWLYQYENGKPVLYVWDYKFGHSFVEVFENWQILDYVCGILDSLSVDGANDQTLEVVMRVVQPRSFHRDGPVREWRATAAELRPYFNKLQMSAHVAMSANARCHVNPECKHCSASHVCEALARASANACDVATRSIPLELPPQAQALELRTLHRAQEALNARVTGIEGSLLSHIKGGVRVPFYGVAQGVGRETWSKPIPEVIALGDMCEVDVRKPGALTPKQAIKAGLPAEVVKVYSHVPMGEIKLVPDNSLTARKVFSKS